MKLKFRDRIVFLLLLCIAPSAFSNQKGDARPAKPILDERFHQFFEYSESVFSGAQPESATTFAAMKEYGINTVISVDGAKPEVEAAKTNGIRYIHLPIGYDAIPEPVALRLAKAVSRATGGVYVHCHHGKHRGPAAAALALTLLGEWNPSEGVAAMKQTGTSPNYSGLYQCVENATAVSKETLDAVPDDFVSIANVKPMASHMAGASRKMETLGLVKAAGWKPLDDHPDINPPHEALQLREHLVESARLEASKQMGEVYMAMMKASIHAAKQLETQLRDNPGAHDALNTHWDTLVKSCKTCHAQFRNTPQ